MKLLHDIVAVVASTIKMNPAASGKRSKNARSISLPSFWQHYLVAMAKYLDKFVN